MSYSASISYMAPLPRQEDGAPLLVCHKMLREFCRLVKSSLNSHPEKHKAAAWLDLNPFHLLLWFFAKNNLTDPL